MKINSGHGNMMIAFKNNNKNKTQDSESFDIVSNPLYIRKFAALLREVTQKGSDLMHLANGNVIITEAKVITYQYSWNKEKNKFERAKVGLRSSKAKKQNASESNKSLNNNNENYYYGDMKNYDDEDEKITNNSSDTNFDEMV